MTSLSDINEAFETMVAAGVSKETAVFMRDSSIDEYWRTRELPKFTQLPTNGTKSGKLALLVSTVRKGVTP